MRGVAHTPLCPAGHLPLKGGDQSLRPAAPTFGVANQRGHAKRLISPLEGEMAGRPEGGAQAPGRPNGGILCEARRA